MNIRHVTGRHATRVKLTEFQGLSRNKKIKNITFIIFIIYFTSTGLNDLLKLFLFVLSNVANRKFKIMYMV